MRKIGLILALLILIGTIACQSTPSNISSSLIVLPGSDALEYRQSDSKEQMSYYVDEPFPADSCLAVMHARLTTMGWIQLKENYLQPDMPLSNNLGLPPAIPGQPLHQDLKTLAAWKLRGADAAEYRWETQYKNPRMDIQVIVLQYFHKRHVESPVFIEEPKTTRLKITQIFLPAALAKKVREAAIQNGHGKVPQGDFDIWHR